MEKIGHLRSPTPSQQHANYLSKNIRWNISPSGYFSWLGQPIELLIKWAWVFIFMGHIIILLGSEAAGHPIYKQWV